MTPGGGNTVAAGTTPVSCVGVDMTVYVEAVIGLNLLVDLVLLALAGLCLGLPLRAGRLIASSLIGAAYALVYLASVPLLAGGGARLAVGLLMVAVAYRPRGLRQLATVFGMFCLASAAAGGFALALAGGSQSAAAGGAIVLGPGGRAAAVLPYALAGSAGLVYLAGGALAKSAVWRRRCLDSLVIVGQQEVRFSALLDTGNELRDPLTRRPVLVVEYAAISCLLPPQVRAGYALGRPEVVAAALQPGSPGESWADRVRLLPFRSVGAAGGLLLGFRPDAVIVAGPHGMRRRLDCLLVAVSPGSLGGGQAYQALLPPSAVA